jgi:hypothetical protein
MGAVRYRYNFDQPPRIEDIVERFSALTGLTVIVEGGPIDCDLSAPPLRESVELERRGNTLWVIAFHDLRIGGSYFLVTFDRVLHDLGAQKPPRRWPAYSARRWADLPRWRQWLNR